MVLCDVTLPGSLHGSLRSGSLSTTGPCVASGDCITSFNYGNGNYANNEACTITFGQSGTLTVDGFRTEPHSSCRYDQLTIGGTRYCGTTGPAGVGVGPSTSATWGTDHSITSSGWKICVTWGTVYIYMFYC